ncbi:MAG TPA: DUF3052 family protein [Thermoanaerobaculia bacterium]|nr:DUF3052 family protein [Thermoanaerobaculia bacterium]
MAGYSGTPLVRKLGIRERTAVVVIDPPPHYAALLGELPEGARIVAPPRRGEIAFIHLFVRSAADLIVALRRYRKRIGSDGVIWVSWPKRASKVATDVTEDVIREVALPMGLVDIKVCAVDETWSGLKLVIRKSER